MIQALPGIPSGEVGCETKPKTSCEAKPKTKILSRGFPTQSWFLQSIPSPAFNNPL